MAVKDDNQESDKPVSEDDFKEVVGRLLKTPPVAKPPAKPKPAKAN